MPNGQALLGAGLAAKRMGDAPQAQRLFDRATVELEAKLAKPVQLEMPNGLPSVAGIAWSPNGKLLAVAAYLYVSIIDVASLRERTLVSGAEGGTVRFWVIGHDGRRERAEQRGTEDIAAYPVRDAEALYAFTPGANPRYELLGDAARDIAVCRVGDWSFPLDSCEERFVVPGLLQRVMAGDSSYLEP